MKYNERKICTTGFEYILNKLYLKQHDIGRDRLMEQRMQVQIREYISVYGLNYSFKFTKEKRADINVERNINNH